VEKAKAEHYCHFVLYWR